MSALAHVLEAAGLATVGISIVRGQAERSRPPRMLHGEFPLGRPLGRPGDAAFQHRVLAAAFALLERDDVPVLVDFPETLTEESDTPLACTLPPRYDPELPPGVDEALGLRPAYERARDGAAGPTAEGDLADRVPQLVELFDRLAAGEPWETCGLTPIELHTAGLDLRAYYEGAALGLVDHVPAARQAESWFFQRTLVGGTLMTAQQRLREADAPRAAWFGLAPNTQPRR